MPVRGSFSLAMAIMEMFVKRFFREGSGHGRFAEREREAQKLTSLQLMAGGVAHDFNNLLAAVLGNASLAEARLPADSFEATLVRRAIRAGEQAAELSLKMLAYAGKAPLVIEPLALASVASRDERSSATSSRISSRRTSPSTVRTPTVRGSARRAKHCVSITSIGGSGWISSLYRC